MTAVDRPYKTSFMRDGVTLREGEEVRIADTEELQSDSETGKLPPSVERVWGAGRIDKEGRTRTDYVGSVKAVIYAKDQEDNNHKVNGTLHYAVKGFHAEDGYSIVKSFDTEEVDSEEGEEAPFPISPPTATRPDGLAVFFEMDKGEMDRLDVESLELNVDECYHKASSMRERK